MKQNWFLTTGTALMLAAALAGCGKTPAADQQQSSQPTSLISMDQAQTAALDAANIDAANADVSSATLSEIAGIICYKVEFTSGDYAYSYSINAESGEVLEMSSWEQTVTTIIPDSGTQADAATSTAGTATTPNAATPPQSSPNTSTGAVSEARAQEIALAHAVVKPADATITKSKLDYDDGRQVYEIEWYANGAKYDYEIAAATGEVVKSDYEAKTVVGTGNNAAISEADAKKTALARVSGATTNDIYEWELDYDDGHPEYEGKIIYGGSEYEFTIDATSGTITEWDVEVIRK